MLYLYLSKSIDLKFALLLHPKLIRRGLCDLQSFDILAAATFSEQTKQCFGETSTKDGQTVHEDNLSMFLFHCYFPLCSLLVFHCNDPDISSILSSYVSYVITLVHHQVAVRPSHGGADVHLMPGR